MKLILQKDVKNLGKTGDQVLVKKGYARNFLIPQGHALPLNKDRLKAWKHQKFIIDAKKRKAQTERKILIEKISSIELSFEKESMKDGRLFGSVTATEISDILEKNHKLSIDKRDISFKTLKTVGKHSITIILDSKHKTDITVHIEGKITKKIEEPSDENLEATSTDTEKTDANLEATSTDAEKTDANLEATSTDAEKTDENLEATSTDAEKTDANLEATSADTENPNSDK